ncbi:MAG: hypothetical protein AAF170_10120 [Bacteroidota bacterium]
MSAQVGVERKYVRQRLQVREASRLRIGLAGRNESWTRDGRLASSTGAFGLASLGRYGRPPAQRPSVSASP